MTAGQRSSTAPIGFPPVTEEWLQEFEEVGEEFRVTLWPRKVK